MVISAVVDLPKVASSFVFVFKYSNTGFECARVYVWRSEDNTGCGSLPTTVLEMGVSCLPLQTPGSWRFRGFSWSAFYIPLEPGNLGAHRFLGI